MLRGERFENVMGECVIQTVQELHKYSNFESCTRGENPAILWFIMNRESFFIIKSIKGELKTRPIYDCRCDERLEPKDDESTCLVYTVESENI